jgi:hypothetical protein
VDLEGHAGAELALRDLGVDADHGQLDEPDHRTLLAQRCRPHC